jgi:hypothetical protein
MLDFVESAWYASAVFVSLYSFWGVVLISKKYILATGIDRMRRHPPRWLRLSSPHQARTKKLVRPKKAF